MPRESRLVDPQLAAPPKLVSAHRQRPGADHGANGADGPAPAPGRASGWAAPSAWARRWPFDIAFASGTALCLVFYGWFMSASLPLADRIGAREHYYTVAASALLHGRLDVPTPELGLECFMVHHRCYGYFGLAPSLLRLPAVLRWGSAAQTDQVERAFFLMGFLLAAAGAWWIARQVLALWAPAAGRRARAAAGLVVALSCLGASPLLFLFSRPLVYEEAILWGVAFASVGIAAAMSLRRQPRVWVLVVLVLADLLGALSRPTVGASAILATVVVGVYYLRPARGQPDRPAGGSVAGGTATGHSAGGDGRFGCVLLAGACLAALSSPMVAYAKFGTFSPPYRDQVLLQTDPSKVATFEHFAGLNPAVLPTKLVSTLRPDSLRLFAHPPYVALGEITPTRVWPAQASDVYWEPTTSVTAALPFLSLLALAGLAVVLARLHRRRRIRGPDLTLEVSITALVSALAALALGLMFPGQTYRYLADWLPLFFVAVPLGIGGLVVAWPSRRGRAIVVLAVLGAAFAGQLTVQTAVAVRNGLTSAYWYDGAVLCSPSVNPYGVLGTTFCPTSLPPLPGSRPPPLLVRVDRTP